MFNMISEHFLRFSRVQGFSAKLYLGAETMIGPVVDPAYFYGLGAKNRLKM